MLLCRSCSATLQMLWPHDPAANHVCLWFAPFRTVFLSNTGTHAPQVLTYMIKDGRFKSQKNKTFKGHNTAGYACQVNCSPDGK